MNEEKYTRLNKYRTMWVLVFFDLPTETKKQRRAASQFRKKTAKRWVSYVSVFYLYAFFVPAEKMQMCIQKELGQSLPEKGHVGILNITDKQLSMMELFIGQKETATKKPSQQLEMF